MSNWTNADGEVEGSASTLTSGDLLTAPLAETGNGGGWEVIGNGPVRHNPSTEYQNHVNDDESEGIMATVRSPQGSRIMTRSPNGKDIVMYQGVGIPLNVAADMGLVVRTPDGSFSDKAAPAVRKDLTGETTAQKASDKNGGDPEPVTFGEAAEATLQELLSTQQPGGLYRTLDSIIQTGDTDRAAIERMASQAGIEPDEMADKVATVWQGVYDAGSEILAGAGIENGDAFQAFVTSDLKRKADFGAAARDFFLHNKTEGLLAMAENYLPAMDRYEGTRVKSMLTEAGWQFSEKPGGGVNVIVSGQHVPWEVAVKQKIITFSRD